MELQGKIIQVLPLMEGVSRQGNPWKVQPYVLETLDQYPRKVYFEVYGEDKIASNPCDIDDMVTISFDIESREFNGRWFTVCRAWKVAKGTQDAKEAKPKGNVINPNKPDVNDANKETDLPF